MRVRAGTTVAATLAVVLLAVLGAGPAAAATPTLEAGVGKADITPRTGYVLGGWTRADRLGGGQHTRLGSRALVLQRGDTKVALVQVDLFMIPGGMVRQIGERLAARGFSEQNILISASHTHSGPGGFANFPTLNTTAPSVETATDPFSFARLVDPSPADPQLYTFLTNQIEKAIVKADEDRAPAEAGWGSARLVGLTQNRSLEAHLADHGILREVGEGNVSEDPGGYEHTIDPDVNVLRVDKLVRRGGRTRRVPIGGWSTFADHGTVTKSSFQFYNADHHASAMRVFEKRVRETAGARPGQEVVNVYGNSNEGDQSAGLNHSGPAGSDEVGRVEAASMFGAWRRAGRALSRTPALDLRFTRLCMCGQEVDGRPVATESNTGLPFLTGSEEGRGPLFDVTQESFEGRRMPTDPGGPHGVKLTFPGLGAGVPTAVPLLAIRIGPRLIASVPGEGTKEVGARLEAAVQEAVAGSGIKEVVISGLANEFILYLTTPEEYDRQHYEGGNTQFGRMSSVLIQRTSTALARSLATGQPAPEAYPFDPTNGIQPDGPAYGPGAESGQITGQPAAAYERLQRAELRWQGGPQGLDRPVGRAFVTAQRRVGKRWRRADSDLGLNMLWGVDAEGRYRVQWEIPRFARAGSYRLVVTAKRYRLTSQSFAVRPSRALTVERLDARTGRVAVRLRYPRAVENVDITYRPAEAAGGRVAFRVGAQRVVAASKSSPRFKIRPRGRARVRIPAGAARDRWGNTNARAFVVR